MTDASYLEMSVATDAQCICGSAVLFVGERAGKTNQETQGRARQIATSLESSPLMIHMENKRDSTQPGGSCGDRELGAG